MRALASEDPHSSDSDDLRGILKARKAVLTMVSEEEIPAVYVYACFTKPGKTLFCVAD